MEILDFEPEEIGSMVTITMSGMPPDTRGAQVTVRINGEQQGRAGVSPSIQRIMFAPNPDVKAGKVKVEIETDQGTLEAQSSKNFIPHAADNHLGDKTPTVTSMTPKMQQPGKVVKLGGTKLGKVNRVRLGMNSSNQATPTSVTENQISFTIPANAKTGASPQRVWIAAGGKYIGTRFNVTVMPAGGGD